MRVCVCAAVCAASRYISSMTSVSPAAAPPAAVSADQPPHHSGDGGGGGGIMEDDDREMADEFAVDETSASERPTDCTSSAGTPTTMTECRLCRHSCADAASLQRHLLQVG